MRPFERATPESVGISSRDLLEWTKAYISEDPREETHAFLLLRHGKLVASGAYAPFSLHDRSAVFSGSKALISMAVGLAIGEGLFALEDPVASFFPELLPPHPQERTLRITVQHLLTMTVGQTGEAVHEGKKAPLQEDETFWAEEFFRRVCDVEPGTEFRYDGYATYMLSRLVLKTAGVDVLEYLRPRLFDKLGMEVPPCIRDGNGVPIGWTGMRLTVGEMARLGQLYLQDGVWEGERILPEGWVALSTRCHISTYNDIGEDWSCGYCFQFWRGMHNTYRFCGARGQMCVISPDTDTVFAVQSGYDNPCIWKELDKFYCYVLLRLQDAPLPPDPEGCAALETACSRLAHRKTFQTPSPLMPLLDGATLPLTANPLYERATFAFSGEAVQITLQGKAGVENVRYEAGLRAAMRSPVACVGVAMLRTDLDTAYSSVARFKAPAMLWVETHIIGTPTNLYLEADFDAKEAKIYTCRGNFDPA